MPNIFYTLFIICAVWGCGYNQEPDVWSTLSSDEREVDINQGEEVALTLFTDSQELHIMFPNGVLIDFVMKINVWFQLGHAACEAEQDIDVHNWQIDVFQSNE